MNTPKRVVDRRRFLQVSIGGVIAAAGAMIPSGGVVAKLTRPVGPSLELWGTDCNDLPLRTLLLCSVDIPPDTFYTLQPGLVRNAKSISFQQMGPGSEVRVDRAVLVVPGKRALTTFLTKPAHLFENDTAMFLEDQISFFDGRTRLPPRALDGLSGTF